MKRRHVGVLALALVALGACGGDDGGSAASITNAGASAATSRASGSAGGAKSDSVQAAPPAQQTGGGSVVADDPAVLASQAAGNKVIYTGRIQIEVKGAVFDAALQAKNIVAINEGFLFSETTVQNEDGQPQSSMTFKLPPEKFAAVMDQFVKQLGVEKGRQVDASDVTAQFVDLSSRLKVAETSLERVRKLLAEAKTVQEILTLEGEVAKREANVEGLKGQLNQLSGRVDYATVTLTIAQKLAPPKEVDDDGIPSPLDGLKAGARAFLGALKVVILVLAVVLPFIPLVLLVWWLARFVYGRLPKRNRRDAAWNWGPWPAQPAASEQPGPVAPPVGAGVGGSARSGSALGGEELGGAEGQIE